MEGLITTVYGIKWKCEGLSQATYNETKLSQLDKVLGKWFTAMRSARKPRTEHMIIEKAKYSYDEMKIID